MKGIDVTKISLTTRDLMREAAKTSGDRTYLIFTPRGSQETFGEFESSVNRISHLLSRRYRVRQGDKICTMSENLPELLHTIMAITSLGAVWVPINSMLVGESLKYIVEASDAAYVCASARFRALVEGVAGSIEGKRVKVLSLESFAEESRGMPSDFDSPARPDDLSMIMFTSGTTGFPKGVMHTHNSYIRTGVRGLEVLDTDSSHRIHIFLPFFHGWAYLLMLGSLYYKCTIIVEDRFHADTYWETIEKYGVTQDHWTGTVPLNLMKHPKTSFEEKARLGIIGTFGALYSDMKERWPNLTFQSLYGQTEHPFMTEVRADEIFPGSDGTPKDPDEILVINEGKPVLKGEVGEIVCRCRCGVRMQGYYKNPEATAGALRDGDLYTGDLGRIDEHGHLQFVGRKKDALRVRGEMVSVEHIEHLISAHAKVAESAVVGYVPSEKAALKEEEIVAHLVLKDGEQLRPEEFHAWSEQNLARFMRPRYLVFRQALPKTATERVQRFKLREEGIAEAVRLF